jgi:phage gp36-like protein
MAAPILKDVASPLSQLLAFASAVVTITNVVTVPLGLVPGAMPVTVVSAIEGGAVRLTITGGTDGERYTITVNALLAGAVPAARSIIVAPLDALWTMPDGSAGWLTIVEFAQKFGLDETIAATDSDGSGVIDRAFLVGALADAQAECEANVAARYALPMIYVPHILKTALADLARVRLYPRGIPETADTAAKAQRDLLKRVASGAINLPGVAGVDVPVSVTTSDPIEFYSGGRTYADGLADY